MPDQIVSVAEIQRRARAAFEQGVPLADCPLNWHSAAYATWCDEYARLARAAAARSSRFAAAQHTFYQAANEQLSRSAQQANAVGQNIGHQRAMPAGAAINARNQLTLERTS